MAPTILLASKNRNTGTSQDGTYRLSENALGTYNLNHFQITNNIYNVQPENSKVYVTHSTDGAVVVTLPSGYYDLEDLRATLASELTAALASTVISVTVDLVTNKFTFTSSVGTISFTFGTNTTQTARYLMGFNAADTLAAASVESVNPADLKLHDMIVVSILQDNNQSITLPTGAEATFIIPIEAGILLGDRINYTRGLNFTQTCKFSSPISFFTIKLFSIDGDLLDVGNADWTLSLERTSAFSS